MFGVIRFMSLQNLLLMNQVTLHRQGGDVKSSESKLEWMTKRQIIFQTAAWDFYNKFYSCCFSK